MIQYRGNKAKELGGRSGVEITDVQCRLRFFLLNFESLLNHVLILRFRFIPQHNLYSNILYIKYIIYIPSLTG